MAAAVGKDSVLRTRVRAEAPSRSSASCSPSCSGLTAPASASVFKAFNRIFRHVLEKGRPDVFIAGDNAQAKAGVEAFIESLGLRPLDVGGLKMAYWLEGAGVITMGLARHGVGNWDFALGVTEIPG
jgi:predicted dinucleotide-binding enzyme